MWEKAATCIFPVEQVNGGFGGAVRPDKWKPEYKADRRSEGLPSPRARPARLVLSLPLYANAAEANEDTTDDERTPES